VERKNRQTAETDSESAWSVCNRVFGAARECTIPQNFSKNPTNVIRGDFGETRPNGLGCSMSGEGHLFLQRVEGHSQYNSGMTVHEKFVEDMRVAGIVTVAYHGRFFWEGPAACSDQRNGPTLQDIINRTEVPLQWDTLDSNYIVYPVGEAVARWKDSGFDSENDGDERDGYKDAYAAKTPKGGDEEDED
jgi:hypothetical protein